MAIYKFYKDYFFINLKDYPNIGIDLEITKILFCLLIGIIIATAILNYRRASTIKVIKRLLRYDATNEENAKTSKELGINEKSLSFILSNNSRLNRLISKVGQKEYTYEEYSKEIKKRGYKEEKTDYKTARLYIREDAIEEAKFLSEASAPTLLSTVLFCVMMVAIFFCIILLLPEILILFNNILEK